jgi:hypothetical protein
MTFSLHEILADNRTGRPVKGKRGPLVSDQFGSEKFRSANACEIVPHAGIELESRTIGLRVRWASKGG